jgi:malate/lactate dehydrogenase
MIDLNKTNDPTYEYLYEKVAKEAENILAEKGHKRGELGFCHLVWNLQKKILKEKYGVKWYSPAERNPHRSYD